MWAEPRAGAQGATSPHAGTSAAQWQAFTRTGWDTDPRLALGLFDRFGQLPVIQSELEALVARHAHEPSIQVPT